MNSKNISSLSRQNGQKKITWVPGPDIALAARTYALNKPAVLEWGLSLEPHPNSLQTVRAVAILRALTGNIDVPGGDIIGTGLSCIYPTLNDRLPETAAKKRLGPGFPFLDGPGGFTPSAHIPALFKAMRTGEPYWLKGLLLFANNPLTTVANAMNVYEALAKLDLLTVTDLFMTPTAAIADYAPPAAAWPEVNHIMDWPIIAGNLVMARQKTSQFGECRQDEWVIDEISRRLGLPGCAESQQDLLSTRLKELGVPMEKLRENVFFYPPHQYRKYLSGGFKTSSGKVELYCRILADMGFDPMPSYKEPPESPVSTPETAREFPYILITGSRRVEFFGSEHRQIASLRRRRRFPLAEMHPDVAVKQGIKTGSWVYVSSPRGRVRMKALITEDIHPRVISVDHGWWYPEKPAPDYGVFESNANLLTHDGPPYDPAFGSYQLRGLLCRVEKDGNSGV